MAKSKTSPTAAPKVHLTPEQKPNQRPKPPHPSTKPPPDTETPTPANSKAGKRPASTLRPEAKTFPGPPYPRPAPGHQTPAKQPTESPSPMTKIVTVICDHDRSQSITIKKEDSAAEIRAKVNQVVLQIQNHPPRKGHREPRPKDFRHHNQRQPPPNHGHAPLRRGRLRN
jgi:hypothetical protein